MSQYRYIRHLIESYPILEICMEEIEKAVIFLIQCYERGGKVLVCGNGGSSADSDHIVGELMKGFLKKRPLQDDVKSVLIDKYGEEGRTLGEHIQRGLPALNLSAHTALVSAFGNDVGSDYSFAQQVLGYGRGGDILIGISTSGNASNVVFAAMAAGAAGLTSIGLTGRTGGRMLPYYDVCICVPAESTPRVQELHLPVYHALCVEVEEYFFPL
ncbi:MAG: SIS domain-containing protein [Spirochaetota bacterium]